MLRMQLVLINLERRIEIDDGDPSVPLRDVSLDGMRQENFAHAKEPANNTRDVGVKQDVC